MLPCLSNCTHGIFVCWVLPISVKLPEPSFGNFTTAMKKNRAEKRHTHNARCNVINKTRFVLEKWYHLVNQ